MRETFFAGIAVADKRHNALGKSHGRLHGNHVDFLDNTHCGNGVRTVRGGEIVQHGHTRYVQEILNGSGNADSQNPHNNGFVKAHHGGPDADIGVFFFPVKQDKEINAGHTVG